RHRAAALGDGGTALVLAAELVVARFCVFVSAPARVVLRVKRRGGVRALDFTEAGEDRRESADHAGGGPWRWAGIGRRAHVNPRVGRLRLVDWQRRWGGGGGCRGGWRQRAGGRGGFVAGRPEEECERADDPQEEERDEREQLSRGAEFWIDD